MNILGWFRKRAAVRYLNSLAVDAPHIPAEVQAKIDILRIKTAEEQYKESVALAEAAAGIKLHAQNASRPSRCWPVKLDYDGLEWVARLPSDNPRADLIGRGHCPEAALVSFDMQWYGSPQ